jgi:hypothetical protein
MLLEFNSKLKLSEANSRQIPHLSWNLKIYRLGPTE